MMEDKKKMSPNKGSQGSAGPTSASTAAELLLGQRALALQQYRALSNASALGLDSNTALPFRLSMAATTHLEQHQQQQQQQEQQQQLNAALLYQREQANLMALLNQQRLDEVNMLPFTSSPSAAALQSQQQPHHLASLFGATNPSPLAVAAAARLHAVATPSGAVGTTAPGSHQALSYGGQFQSAVTGLLASSSLASAGASSAMSPNNALAQYLNAILMTNSHPDTAITSANSSTARRGDDLLVDEGELNDEEYFKGKGSEDSVDDGMSESFPEKLYRVIYEAEKAGKNHLIEFFPDGQGFIVHKPEEFAAEIMPNYFKSNRFESLHRQLNLYGFQKMHDTKGKGRYFHRFFQKGKRGLCRRIARKKKRTKKAQQGV